MKKIQYLLLVCVLCALHGTLYAQNSFNMTDVLGRRVSFNAIPQRVISLSPGVTEILFAIGAGTQVVGVTEYCNYPPETANRTKVGGFSGITVNVEQIVVLKPDLVIVSGEMHERIIALLDGLGIKSFAVEPSSFAQVYTTIEIIGQLTGHESGASRVVAAMRAKIVRAQVRRGNQERPGVFWELTDDPLMSIGGNTFISEAISLAGGKNIFEDLSERWPIVSAEQVLLRRPAWILAGDDHGVIIEPQALARRPGWSALPAVRNKHVALVNADMLYRYGPRLADAVLAIATILFTD
ncbi:MAG: cobalamin-binding protein [Treponema sp.]|jgi:iron complex transport system substrate-binding protein|nr:cobalamin-binding protein [Treponema sp.]